MEALNDGKCQWASNSRLSTNRNEEKSLNEMSDSLPPNSFNSLLNSSSIKATVGLLVKRVNRCMGTKEQSRIVLSKTKFNQNNNNRDSLHHADLPPSK